MKTINLTGPFPLEAEDLGTILEQNGIRNGSINPRQQTATGFSQAGMIALASLAKTFRPSQSLNSYRASNATLAKLLAAHVMGQWIGRASSTLAQPDFAQLHTAVDRWFASLTQVREHVVPCTLFPYPNTSFAIGPVIFRHVSELPTEGFGVSREEFWPPQPPPSPPWKQWLQRVWAATRKKQAVRREIGGFLFSSLIQFATTRNAPWMAFVKVAGRPDNESIRAADIATDVALAVIQLVSPGDDMRSISRATARAAPVWRVDVSRVENGGFSTGSRNQVPALARSHELIERHIKQAEPAFQSMGQRLSAFLDATSPVPDLDEAWCNAAYWYHEALAETLDTVAVAKLETAIEVLFRAENMSRSMRRLLESFDVFFGLSRSEPIVPNGTVTVEQFAEAIITARSRVLHGTWPTLQFDLPANKSNQTVSYNDVEFLTRTLLVCFSAHLDAYIAAGNPTDTTDAFFAWIKAERTARAGGAAAATDNSGDENPNTPG